MSSLAKTIRDRTRNAIVDTLCQASKEGTPIDVSVVLEPDGCFRAIDRNNYDVDCDHTGFFTKSPTGYGRTPLDAIVDLLDNTAGL